MAIHKNILIREKDNDGSLIFKSSSSDTVYSIRELASILSKLIGIKIPYGLTIVQRKHWVTYEVLRLLGYKKPRGLRTKEARECKPKFKHQNMDIFVQKHSNLQIWNYIPYTTERYNCRYVIFKVDDEKILGLLIATGRELKNWDTTGTKTIKWQATISAEMRDNTSNRILTSDKDPLFQRVGLNENKIPPLKSRIDKIKELQKNKSAIMKTPPDFKLLVSIKELGVLLQPLLNCEIPYTSEKIIGQNFQKLVAERIGYTFKEGLSINSGQIPDLIHQLIETKIHISATIDLGNSLPVSNEALEFYWNTMGATPSEIRYVVAIADKIKNETVKIGGIIITSGEDFEKFFSIWSTSDFKVQMTIPSFDTI